MSCEYGLFCDYLSRQFTFIRHFVIYGDDVKISICKMPTLVVIIAKIIIIIDKMIFVLCCFADCELKSDIVEFRFFIPFSTIS